MEFSEKLIILRKENRLTQAQLGACLGVTRQTVYKWETGQSYPEAMTLLAIRNLFHVPTDTLLDNTIPLQEKKDSIKETQSPGEQKIPEEEKKEAETEEVQEEARKGGMSKEEPKKKKGIFSRLLGR